MAGYLPASTLKRTPHCNPTQIPPRIGSTTPQSPGQVLGRMDTNGNLPFVMLSLLKSSVCLHRISTRDGSDLEGIAKF